MQDTSRLGCASGCNHRHKLCCTAVVQWQLQGWGRGALIRALTTVARPPPRPAGDGNTTTDNMLALRAFYQRFPAMRQRPLFVAGQGYAGARAAAAGRDSSCWSRLVGAGGRTCRRCTRFPAVLPAGLLKAVHGGHAGAAPPTPAALCLPSQATLCPCSQSASSPSTPKT